MRQKRRGRGRDDRVRPLGGRWGALRAAQPTKAPGGRIVRAGPLHPACSLLEWAFRLLRATMPDTSAPRHIRLTSHAGGQGALAIHWGAATPAERGPIVGTTTKRAHRNVIGTHSGSYSV